MKKFTFVIIACVTFYVSAPSIEKEESQLKDARTTWSSAHNSSRSDNCKDYVHRSEPEIASLRVDQKLDEAIREFGCHRTHYEYHHLLEKSLRKDGAAVFPELIRRFTDDGRAGGNTDEHSLQAFFVLVVVADDLDNRVIRLRGTERGKRVIDSLQTALDRMKKGASDRKDLDQYDDFLRNLRGVNVIDQYVANTLEESDNIRIVGKEQLDFSNFLVALDPSYPMWSEIDEEGVLTLKDSKRFHLAYLQFKKS